MAWDFIESFYRKDSPKIKYCMGPFGCANFTGKCICPSFKLLSSLKLGHTNKCSNFF